MKKMKEKHNEKDRIVCVSLPRKQSFYYQPVGTKERLWLFDTDVSEVVFAFFRQNGRCLEGRGFSLTCKELYKIGYGRSKKINKILDRIPVQADYVLREYVNAIIQSPRIDAARYCRETDDYDRAA